MFSIFLSERYGYRRRMVAGNYAIARPNFRDKERHGTRQ
jgi:hypothetical protein